MQAQNEKSFSTNPSIAIESQRNTRNLIETLPMREGWSSPLVLYKNFWIRSSMLDGAMRVQDNFKPRSTDVILATHPKCGTTWLQALAFAIINRSRYTFSDHPLNKHNPQELVPFIGLKEGDVDQAEMLPSPRLLSTHLPLSLLPPTVSTCGCKIVYICREPKDALVSRWHFDNRLIKGDPINFNDAFEMYCEGFSPFGPFWDHYLQYWNESLKRPHEILFLKYEEIVLDPLKVVWKLASFLGVPFTGEEQSRRVDEEVVRLCSFETLSSQGVNQKGGVEHAGSKIFFEFSSLFRKGKVGDWVKHMSTEMAEKLDFLVEEKFKGSGLKF